MMFSFAFTLACTIGFLALMAGVAWFSEYLRRKGVEVRPAWMYVLAIAVYGTSWTFFGSVGLAKANGLGFLPVYLGPTLAIPLWMVLVRKQIRLTQKYRITSMSDLLAARYGKSLLVGAVAASIMVIGQIPYITLQVKSIASTFQILTQNTAPGTLAGQVPLLVTTLLTGISILFGARSLDPSEKHEGLLAAVVFESAFKLVIFLAAGFVILFAIFAGPDDLMARSLALPHVERFFTLQPHPIDWFIMLVVSGLAFMFLPHVYQAAVMGNHDERHVATAAWMFPLYLLLINVFVIPVAMAGLIYFQQSPVPADTYMLALPLAAGMPYLALFVYLAGLGAGAGMSILAAIALASMMTNNLVLPVLLNIRFLGLHERRNLSTLILMTRRLSLAFIFFLAWAYYMAIAGQKSLVSIGLVSFVGISQLAPAMIGGLFWKRANRRAALVGMILGFALWFYMLPLASMAEAGVLPRAFLDEGPLGLAFLRPMQFLGLTGLDPISHAAFWSLAVNLAAFILVSSYTKARAIEQHQAELFVDVLHLETRSDAAKPWKITASFKEILGTLKKYMGIPLAKKEISAWMQKKNMPFIEETTDFEPDPEFMDHVETLIAGVIGQASARIMIRKMAAEDDLSYHDMVTIMNESSEIKKYSAELKLALDTVQKLKDQQDGDYFLTTLLLDPFQGHAANPVKVPVAIHLEQKKTFEFKKKKYQLGGDIALAGEVRLGGEDYTLFASADAMGKSIQGAGGALVFAAVLRNVMNINQAEPDNRHLPVDWLKKLYRELQSVFLTFDGSMYISAAIGLLHNASGAFHHFNAEHPWTVRYAQGEAAFIENELMVHKLGTGMNPPDIEIRSMNLSPGDIIVMGSDGRDDVILASTKQMNEDEFRFLACVKQGEGQIPAIVDAVKKDAALTDDFSLLAFTYTPVAAAPPVNK